MLISFVKQLKDLIPFLNLEHKYNLDSFVSIIVEYREFFFFSILNFELQNSKNQKSILLTLYPNFIIK